MVEATDGPNRSPVAGGEPDAVAPGASGVAVTRARAPQPAPAALRSIARHPTPRRRGLCQVPRRRQCHLSPIVLGVNGCGLFMPPVGSVKDLASVNRLTAKGVLDPPRRTRFLRCVWKPARRAGGRCRGSSETAEAGTLDFVVMGTRTEMGANGRTSPLPRSQN